MLVLRICADNCDTIGLNLFCEYETRTCVTAYRLLVTWYSKTLTLFEIKMHVIVHLNFPALTQFRRP